ncbi:PASTA domain-containing protein [Fluviicola chungangensis]|uniref:PASTA domain-containing protein n=1 Tax=Fluviicola chungangensis TaxID=2597671 RepID=A0A556MNJ3_9FLAO|nr:PASTA domain-containing protein [Fluviicola chungangensis]TSJ41534.1 PASTA domain-containing protein [Fluviicola chungangensis]
MIDFNYFILKLKLYTGTNDLAENFAASIQYYSFVDSDWITVFGGNTKSGFLVVNQEVRDANSTQALFYDLIAQEKLPPMRIIPDAPLSPDITKQPVIGSSFTFNLEPVDGMIAFEIDFGTLYMIPNELILDSSSAFADILPVANYFPVTVTIPEPAVPPIPIQDLYTNLVSEIAAASQTSSESPFKLSNISVKLKALVHGDGESLSASLLNLENSENVNGEAISELFFDITPVHNRENLSISMPDVMGLTETAVRRILKKAGLRLNPVYQKKESVVNGDSFKQSPLKGISVQPNQLVTVIFSKHE